MLFYHYSPVVPTSTEESVTDRPISARISPNPVRDQLFFSGIATVGGSASGVSTTLDLYDLNGRLVRHEDAVYDGTPVEVGDLVSGLYLYKLTVGDKIKTGSVVKVD